MLRQKRIMALFAAVVTAAAVCFTAYAHPVPELDRKGSIEVFMSCGETAGETGAMMLYRVGEIQEQDGNYGFALSEAFADSGVQLQEPGTAELAGELADYAAENEIPGEERMIARDGSIRFAELEPGLYLLVQSQPREGVSSALPFLVSLPMLEDGTYIYEVDASPKVELLPSPTPEPEVSPTVTPEPEISPTVTPKPEVSLTPRPGVTTSPPAGGSGTPSDSGYGSGSPGTDTPTLPQTGQMNWPVPVLTAAGLFVFTLGWIMRFGKRKDDEK